MIELKPLQREDYSKVVEWNKDKTSDFLHQWAGDAYKYPLTEEQIEKFISDSTADISKAITVYKIVMKDTDEVVGTIELRRYDKEENTARVCRFLIIEGVRGSGIGKEALIKLVTRAFKQLNYRKVCLGVFDFNKAAIACYEAAGFKKDKLVENWIKASDGYWNLYEMSISKEAWEKQK